MALNLGELFFRLNARTDGLNRSERHVRRFASNAQRDLARTTGATAALGRAFATVLTLETARRLVQTADNFNLLQQRIKSATAATGDHISVMRNLIEISNRNGQAIDANVQLFHNFARVAPDIGATNDEALKLVNTINQLSVIGGTSSAATRFGLVQLSQAFASGQLRGDELRSILENIPEVANAIARGLGLSVGAMRELAFEGGVTARDVFEALQGQADEIATRFEQIPPTVERSFTTFKNSFATALDQFDEAFGVTRGISNNLENWAQILQGDFSDDIAKLKLDIGDITFLFAQWESLISRAAEPLRYVARQIGDSFSEETKRGLEESGIENLDDVLLKGLEGGTEAAANLPRNLEGLFIFFTEGAEAARQFRRDYDNAFSADRRGREFAQGFDAIAQGELDYENEQKALLAKEQAQKDADANKIKQEQEQNEKLRQEQIKKHQGGFESLRNSLLTETELENQHYQEALANLQTAEELKIETLVGYQELRERLQEEHFRRLKDLEQKHSEDTKAIRGLSAFLGVDLQKKASDLTVAEQGKGFRSQIDQAAQYNKQFFQLQKALALASALVKAPSAVLGAYEFGSNTLGGGPILGAVMAGIAGAATAVQIAAISSASYTGKATGGNVFAGGMYEVNEQGPELLSVGGKDLLMMGSQGGYITPNSKLGGRVPDSNVVVNIYPRPGETARVATREDEEGGQQIDVIIEQVEQRIASGIAQGGSDVATAMEGQYGLNRANGGTG